MSDLQQAAQRALNLMDLTTLNDDDASVSNESETVMSVIDGDKPDHHDDDPDDTPPPPRGGRPALRVVK